MTFTKNITIPLTKEEHDLRAKIKEHKKIADNAIFRRGMVEIEKESIGDLAQNNIA
jgi:hypothetical protein